MKLFNCQNCGNTLFFENTSCEQCGMPLGYIPERNQLSALQETAEGWAALADTNTSAGMWRYCANHQHEVCNWLIDSTSGTDLCIACELNRYIPNLATPGQKEFWRELEFSKHRLVYSLLRFNLPVISKAEQPEDGLAFDFVSEENQVPQEAETQTGHAEGQITINTAEADPVEREQMRENMGEPYRTLIGHFRHEVGHYYWDRLVAPFADITRDFRALFGDERNSYQEALNRHYQNGAPADWNQYYISAYASSHPWEDWAESWAHYFHMVDTLETAYAFGMKLKPVQSGQGALRMNADIDPYDHRDFDDILNRYLPLTFSVNSLNRSMGQPDIYPFVLSDPVKSKLSFIHTLLLKQKH